jgi:hypothetical protein
MTEDHADNEARHGVPIPVAACFHDPIVTGRFNFVASAFFVRFAIQPLQLRRFQAFGVSFILTFENSYLLFRGFHDPE